MYWLGPFAALVMQPELHLPPSFAPIVLAPLLLATPMRLFSVVLPLSLQLVIKHLHLQLSLPLLLSSPTFASSLLSPNLISS